MTTEKSKLEKQYLKQMLILQNDFNADTNGKDWKSGVTKEGKTIDWRLCISQETAELTDSFPWKHWKSIDQEADLDNAKMELIDMWHFIMSEEIRVTDNFNEKFVKNLVDRFHKSSLSASEHFPDKSFKSIKKYISNLQNVLNDLEIERNLFSEKVMFNFFSLANFLDMPIEKIYKLYIIKNVLNKFRQANGYKENKYLKHIKGEEDNEIIVRMAEELDKMNGLSFNSLYLAYDYMYVQYKKEIES